MANNSFVDNYVKGFDASGAILFAHNCVQNVTFQNNEVYASPKAKPHNVLELFNTLTTASGNRFYNMPWEIVWGQGTANLTFNNNRVYNTLAPMANRPAQHLLLNQGGQPPNFDILGTQDLNRRRVSNININGNFLNTVFSGANSDYYQYNVQVARCGVGGGCDPSFVDIVDLGNSVIQLPTRESSPPDVNIPNLCKQNIVGIINWVGGAPVACSYNGLP